MNWKEQFDELYEVRIKQKSGNRPLGQEAVKTFIQAEIIEKLIDEIPDSYKDTPVGFVTNNGLVRFKQQLRHKWL